MITKTYVRLAATAVILGALSPNGAIAQEKPPITNEQYNELKRELEEMKAMIRELRGEQANQTKQAKPIQPAQPIQKTAQPIQTTNVEPQATSDQPDGMASLRLDLQQTNRRLDDLQRQTLSLEPGETGFHLTGYAFTLLKAPEGGDTTFNAAAVPLILWQINDRLLFETEFELGFDTAGGRTTTEVDLEYADLQYLVNDYLVVGAGKFLTPFGLFSERLHPAWINKLPNAPLVRGHDGLAPFASTGVYVRGAVPVGKQRFNYALYAVNGPTLVDAATDVAEFGKLDFNGFGDNKAIGGRFGYLPVPQFELGYSFMYSETTSDTGLDSNSVIMGVDASYIIDTKPGLFDFRFEYVYSNVDSVTFDATGALGVGPTRFNNERNGLYAQAAFRPIHANSDFLKNIECVGRYDYMKSPDTAPEGGKKERWTFGVNYWFNPSTVLKFAYDPDLDGGDTGKSFLVMVAVGF